jgi:hypothetical protein
MQERLKECFGGSSPHKGQGECLQVAVCRKCEGLIRCMLARKYGVLVLRCCTTKHSRTSAREKESKTTVDSKNLIEPLEPR